MPRENRKRGKKNKVKQVEQTQDDDYRAHFNDFEPEDGLQISTAADGEVPASLDESPFGALDPDVKAYFRTVDDQLREWQEERPDVDIDADLDPNEERRMFFTAALSEMNGKELQLATDPDCSPVLERMLYSMDDFVRRVFADSLAGSWSQLITNRFASHVCQTLFTVVVDTVARETRGVLPSPTSEDSRGELLTMTQLILNACEDIVPELPHLIQNAFASHVLRALLILLAPSQLAPSQSRSHRHAPYARSKKSASWKARHGPMKAVITDNTQHENTGANETLGIRTPDSFVAAAERFVDKVRSELDGNEVRALAVDKVASPLLQMLLELEASIGKADHPGSIMDHVLTGLVTESQSNVAPSASLYVNALILDTTSSHLSESIFSCCPSNIFDRLWDCYVRGDLPRLAAHPVANFVVARGVERLEAEELRDAVTQLNSTWSKSLKVSRMGVLTSLVDRAGQIHAQEAELVEAICSMVEVNTEEERKALVPCLLRLKTCTEYHDMLTSEATRERDLGISDGPHGSKQNGSSKPRYSPLEPKVQGSILLQSLLRLREPYNHVVLESLHSLFPAELLALAQNATSSRVLDAVLESPHVPLRSRKRLVTAFIGHFHLLVDDRIGSRVADRCWEAADPYLKEKIARSMIPHEQFLAGSHFGRFFARNLNLPLLQRRPDQWKVLQSKNRKLLTDANAISTTPSKSLHPSTTEAEAALVADSKRGSKRKRKDATGGDEIDALFSGIGAKKRAKGVVEAPTEAEMPIEKGDATLDAVLGAIRTAPSDSRLRRNKK